jgi:hypothetical protein
MWKKLFLAALITTLLVVTGVRASRASGGIPTGVSPEMWHPLSDRIGIAIRAERGLGRDQQIVGTLMVREGDRWRPISLTGAPGVVPAR